MKKSATMQPQYNGSMYSQSNPMANTMMGYNSQMNSVPDEEASENGVQDNEDKEGETGKKKLKKKKLQQILQKMNIQNPAIFQMWSRPIM